MMGPVLCHRHGVRFFRRASKGIGARIRTRGRFAHGELVKVSLDRPKGSKIAWMLRADLDAHQVDPAYVDNVAHVTAFPQIAALERAWTHVCPACLDELLVRSGEVPDALTPEKQAFDTAVVAEGVTCSGSIAQCELHGLIFPTRSSLDIEEAILTIDVLREVRVVRVVDASMAHEPVYWFDEAFLQKVFGPDIEIVEATFRLESRVAFVKLWNAGERFVRSACGTCCGVAVWLMPTRRREGSTTSCIGICWLPCGTSCRSRDAGCEYPVWKGEKILCFLAMTSPKHSRCAARKALRATVFCCG
ncbi:hypothetical protein WK64_19450 [Burkholderia ubonensis]|nr:hypothetical protein WK64_19450 [Burkholderia ubonensis]